MASEFAKIAAVDSDCSSAKKGGDLGWFGHGMMQKSFEVRIWDTAVADRCRTLPTPSSRDS